MQFHHDDSLKAKFARTVRQATVLTVEVSSL